MRPHRLQPTRLRRPWDSPGKNTGVGCHCLLQCMKVKSESEVAQSCPTLSDPMDCSLPGSSIHGIFQARVLEWGAIAVSNLMSYWLVDISSIKVPIGLQLPWSRFLNIMLWIWCGFGQWNQIYQPQVLNDLVFFLVWNYQVISKCQGLFSLDNMLKVAQVRLNAIILYHHWLRHYHHWLWRCKEKRPISPCRA